MINNLLMATGKSAVSTLNMVDPFGDGSGLALYKFDGDVLDASNSYNGTSPTNVSYVAGKFGQAISATTAESSSVSLGLIQWNTPKTVSLWAKNGFAIGNGRSGVSYDTFSFSNSGVDMYVLNTSSPSTPFTLRFTEPCTDFTHFVVTINYPTVIVYVNGVQKYSGTMSVNVSTSNYTTGIFNIANTAGPNYQNHIIDQFRIFNRALTQAEVISLYEEGGDTYVPYVPPQGFFNDGTEVAHYAFDGDATDSTGNNNGTASNVTYTTGKIGQCAVFNGSSSYVTFPSFLGGGEYISFSMWIMFNNSTEQVFFDTQLWNSTNGFGFYKNTSNKLSINFKASGVNAGVATTNTVPIGSLFHLVIIKNQGVLSVYINNVLFHTATITNLTNILSQAGTIGRQYSPAVSYLNGQIDQFRIFNRALTQEEVTALYNEGQ